LPTRAADLVFPGDATIAGIADGTVTVGGLLTADISGGTVYAGSLLASAVSGGDIHVVGDAHVTTMTGGVIVAGTFAATTVTSGTIHATGDARITTLSGATVIVDGAAFFTTIASGTLTVNGPATITTISSGSFTLNGNVILTTFSAGALSLNGLTTSITTLSGGTIDLGSTNLTLSSGTFAGTFTGGTGTIIKVSTGVLTLTQANTFGGTIRVTAGSLEAAVAGALGGVTVIDVQGASLVAVDYDPTASLRLDATATATISGSGLSLGATINDNSATPDALHFTGTSGTITLLSLSGSGLSRFASDATILGGISSGTVKAAGLLTSAITGGTVTAGSLAASAITGGNITVAGDASVGILTAGTLNLGATSTLTVSEGTMTGTITGAGAMLVKDGPGVLTLTAANTYAGGTWIHAGTLIVEHEDGLGTGPVTVNGGTLLVDAEITNTVVAASGGTVSGSGSVGPLTLGSGSIFSHSDMSIGLSPSSLQISGGATLVWHAYSPSLGTAGYDSPAVNGALDLSQASPSNRITIRIISLAQPGDRFPGNPLDFSSNGVNRFIFMTYGSPLNQGSNGNIADLFTYDLSQFSYSDGSSSDANLWSMSFDDTSGQLTLSAVPEPTTYGIFLGALGLAVAALRRRRVRRA
jgi:autotransporter-associated beta strand protein